MKHFSSFIPRGLPAIFFISLLFCGCKKDTGSGIPSYIHIDSIQLTTLSGQGTSSAKITDAWVFVGGQLIGAFELPCTVPVLADGQQDVIIRAGIKMNGASATRAMYPFYKGWENTVTLTRGQVTTITPSVEYFPGTNFMWIEDFEQPGQTIDDSTGANYLHLLKVDTLPADVFEGHKCGAVHLRNDTINFIARSGAAYSIDGSSDTYLELNYRCNTPFAVGVIYAGIPEPWVTIDPSETWNKIYIRLTDAISSQNLPAGNYQVSFTMQKDAAQSDSWLYLDNIKLLK